VQQLEPVLVEELSDVLPGGNGEAVLVKGHE
jgi:hypothetical protein